MFTTYIDKREKPERAQKLLEKINNAEQAQNLIGDVVAGNVCIEIKTPSDFLASMSDGRLKQQPAEMIENYKHNHIILLGTLREVLEHNLKEDNKQRFSKNAIIAMVASITTRYGVNVTFIDNLSFAIDYMNYLIEKGNDGKIKEVSPIKRQAKTWEKQVHVLSSYPKISQKRAEAILQKFGNLNNVFNASVEELCEVEGISKKLAGNIVDLNDEQYNKEV